MDPIADIIAALSLLIAGAAFARTIRQDRRQEAFEGQQIARAQQAWLEDNLPELMPINTLRPKFGMSPQRPIELDVTAMTQDITVQNIGRGEPRDVRAVLYGCASYIVPDTMPDERTHERDGLCWVGEPEFSVRPGATTATGIELTQRRGALRSDIRIGRQALHAPPEPAPTELNRSDPKVLYSARLTLTYRDRFNRKHAATYDYDHLTGRWCRTDVQIDIDQDLLDLLAERPGAKLS